ncbi:MAG: MBL fold metallo-hydrolase [Methanomassiliicoccales archaeon]|jgi:glyoxylase-like metal-dependent hydrolase (beta-lactamase superfamily II)
MRATAHIASVSIKFNITLQTGEKLQRSVYSYVVHGEQVCIVDAGVAGSARTILDLLDETCGVRRKPNALLLTHTHPDHIGSARTLREELGIPVGCPSGEADWIEHVEIQAKERPVPGINVLVEGSVPVDFEVDDGMEMDLGGVKIVAIRTPGHSVASTCYEVVEDDAIISGDAVPLLTEPPIYDDAVASLESVRRLKSRSPEHLLPSWHVPLHGPDVETHLADGGRAIIRFHEAVMNVLDSEPDLDDEMACAMVLSELGLASGTPNPLALRTFRAHRRALDVWPA